MPMRPVGRIQEMTPQPNDETQELPPAAQVLAAQTNIMALVLNAMSDRVMLFLRTIILPLIVVGAMWWLYDNKLTNELTQTGLYALGAFGFFASAIVWIARK